jgi:hypothetical protein
MSPYQTAVGKLRCRVCTDRIRYLKVAKLEPSKLGISYQSVTFECAAGHRQTFDLKRR